MYVLVRILDSRTLVLSRGRIFQKLCGLGTTAEANDADVVGDDSQKISLNSFVSLVSGLSVYRPLEPWNPWSPISMPADGRQRSAAKRAKLFQ